MLYESSLWYVSRDDEYHVTVHENFGRLNAVESDARMIAICGSEREALRIAGEYRYAGLMFDSIRKSIDRHYGR